MPVAVSYHLAPFHFPAPLPSLPPFLSFPLRVPSPPPPTSVHFVCKPEVPTSPPLIQGVARGAHRTQGNTFTILLKDLIKDTDEQPDEEMHRLRSGRVLSAGALVPVVMEIYHPPGVIVFTSLKAH